MLTKEIQELMVQARVMREAGDLAGARRQLLSAKRLNPDNAQVYVELSKLALDDHERRSCLEEVLRCDPANAWAALELAGTSALPAEHPLQRPAEVPSPVAGLAARAAAAPTLGVGAAPAPQLPIANPWAGDPPELYRCPFCARPNPGSRRCSSCGKKLYITEYDARSTPLWILFSILLGTTGLRAALLLLAYGIANATARILNVDEAMLSNQLLSLFTNIWVLIAVGYPAVTAIGLMLRWRWAWWVGMVLAVIDALITMGAFLLLLSNGVLPLEGVISVVVAWAVVGLFFSTTDDIFGRSSSLLVRKLVPPESAKLAYTVGLDYSRMDAWFLASLVWQSAIMRDPTLADYRRALGLAYLQLGIFDAAAFELQEALRLNPADPKTRELIELVRREQPGALAMVGVRG